MYSILMIGFELAFRTPLQQVNMLELAASATHDIAVVIFQAIQYLKPAWLDYNFTFNGPRRLLESGDIPLVHEEEEYGCFDRNSCCLLHGLQLQTP
ncbi:hypothetical protein EYC84_003070 [Monilinia fructicola]|uniref:LRR-containing protein second PH domain-containing protein n=1 Tax=Monilinia fructicola TaxID=38448 RepID=A0A5M9JV12_MONFR|nr:hypothetical protein EYC84_003070 [Monilinia fructicola]